MSTLYLILLIAGCVCFLVDALGFNALVRISLTPLGLFLVFLVPVIQRLNT